ncbi:MAG: orotidine-5'-phosphate decarboxylase, partial [Actinobacteria bacterium]|nr:orotidine-5'-phosphate decarboxylase [Actinomycetota bacterium]
LKNIGVAKPLPEQVEALARMADDSGCDGVVCSPQEADVLRVLLGDGAAIVTPGIRPQGSAKGDQSRISTPSQAIKAGASHLVIGRPITQAVDPILAFETIVRELEEELS